INEMMGNYDTVKQDKNFEFNLDNEYVRAPLYSTEYEKKFLYEPDPMPPYWANLEGYILSEAEAWAKANGVSLSVSVINMGEPGFDASMEGLIVDQSVRYGALISEYHSGSVTLMGVAEVDESKMVPDFVTHNYEKAEDWAERYGIPISISWDDDAEGKVGDVVKQDPKPYTSIDDCEKLKITVKTKVYDIRFNSNGHGSAPGAWSVEIPKDSDESLPWLSSVVEGSDTYNFLGWYTDKTGGSRVYSSYDVSSDVTLYAHWERVHEHTWEVVTEATCTEAGLKRCTQCETTMEIPALGHDYKWDSGSDATCTDDGSVTYKCSRCGATYTDAIPALGHDWVDDLDDDGNPTGGKHCSRCGIAYTE
ncbi:MAG: PASTA domain-containing protein, partial [Erysipelotrichaceae bacterium]|nr:PASTA domain-containing protein [Erysipelotrichaceae bacterium]